MATSPLSADDGGTAARRPITSVVLVGMMGAGKTTVGQALARRLGWEFLDSDRQVEAMTGRGVAQIWREDGEDAFRRLEARVLADALASTLPTVIAAAGGVVLHAGNRHLLQEHPAVVWLRARPEILATRVGRGQDRPLLDDDPVGALARLDAERRPHYEQVADVVIDVDDRPPEEVVERIRAYVADRPPAASESP